MQKKAFRFHVMCQYNNDGKQYFSINTVDGLILDQCNTIDSLADSLKDIKKKIEYKD